MVKTSEPSYDSRQRLVFLLLQLLGDVFSSLTAAVGAADKVVELMQQRPTIPPHGALQPADFAGRVELDSVTFSYPARPEAPVLNGLSLKVNPGEVQQFSVDHIFSPSSHSYCCTSMDSQASRT